MRDHLRFRAVNCAFEPVERGCQVFFRGPVYLPFEIPYSLYPQDSSPREAINSRAITEAFNGLEAITLTQRSLPLCLRLNATE